MFRIVTHFVEQPTLLVICDDHHCGTFATSTLPAGTGESDRSAAIQPFVAQISAAGWVIAIDRHLCPGHAAKIREGRRLVQVPGLRM